MFIMSKDIELTTEMLVEFIKEHKGRIERYERLEKMYNGDHKILSQKGKDKYKPDNRLVVNFAKYIVDTLNGFFIGIPVKQSHNSEEVAKYLDFLNKYNNQDDNNVELSKLCSIYGHAYEMVFMDEIAQVGITYLNPKECFVIYDDSILRRPLYAVRYFINTENIEEGSVCDSHTVKYFTNDGGLKFTEEKAHPFRGVPIIEYIENAERQSAFENVETLINEYDKALSEKANDVDYYADAYLKVLGVKLEEATLKTLRDSRIINLSGEDAEKVVVEFLQKPNADSTQENLINRVEKLIFQISMIANINDENFGNASGISLKYKLQSMTNICKNKERKFMAGMNKRYKLISNVPISKMGVDDWMGIEYKFTQNMPNNILEETQIAQNLSGIASEETQLKVLSVVESVTDEMEKKQASIDKSSGTFTRLNTDISDTDN